MTQYICSLCKHVGKPRKVKPGSGKVEMIMWALFPLGIPYTIWRMLAKKKVCSMCDNDILVRDDSQLGQRILENLEREVNAEVRPHPSMLQNSNQEPMPKPTPEAIKTQDKTLPTEEKKVKSALDIIHTPASHKDPNQW